jgi:hypothetical protein
MPEHINVRHFIAECNNIPPTNPEPSPSTGCIPVLSGSDPFQPKRTVRGTRCVVVLLHQQHKTKNKMKAIILIAAAVFTLQVSSLFAENNMPPTGSIEKNETYCVSLQPSTPAEASFEDGTPVKVIVSVSPVTPAEATFEEESEFNTDLISAALMPVTPAEADFNEDEGTISTMNIAPVTPAEADFSEML